MPRTGRATPGGYCYHVLNRGNNRARVLHDDGDFQDFIARLQNASNRVSMRVLAYCLMPNHFHLVVWPYGDGDQRKWMQLALSGYVRDYQIRHQSIGHIWQGRFKAFAIENDDHLLAVIRYVERNALRAGLVDFVTGWKWSSIAGLPEPATKAWLHDWPIVKPEDWLTIVQQPQTEAELAAIRSSIDRDFPTVRVNGHQPRQSGWGWDQSCGHPDGRGRIFRQE